MQGRITGHLTLKALDIALGQRSPGERLIHHSVRVVQYAAGDYQKLLKEHGITVSMSRKGNCYDNAPMESFFGKLKSERIHHRDYETREEAKTDVFEYIECSIIARDGTQAWAT